MPYVPESRAAALMAGRAPVEPGDLAFLIADEIRRYLEAYHDRYGDLDFAKRNEVAGVLINVLHEYQRRFLDDYEDFKRESGGADPWRVLTTL